MAIVTQTTIVSENWPMKVIGCQKLLTIVEDKSQIMATIQVSITLRVFLVLLLQIRSHHAFTWLLIPPSKPMAANAVPCSYNNSGVIFLTGFGRTGSETSSHAQPREDVFEGCPCFNFL